MFVVIPWYLFWHFSVLCYVMLGCIDGVADIIAATHVHTILRVCIHEFYQIQNETN